MKSKTKNMLTEKQIVNLVKVNFGDNCKIGEIKELKGGMFNSAYLIERPLQQDWIVLKVSIRPDTKTLTYESDPMPTEVAVFEMIAKQTDIPTPKILAVDFSKKHIPSNYFFMTFLNGVAMHTVQKKMSKENLVELKLELAQYMAELHQIHGEYFGYFTQKKSNQFQTWKEAFFSMMTTLLEDAKRNKTKLPYERYEKVLRKHAACFEEIKVPSLVDYDLWAGNIFVKQQGESYVMEGIIDFERAFWGDPFAEFQGSVMLLNHIFEEKEIWNAYKKRAGFTQELTEQDKIRSYFYSLYIYTIMAAETFRYGFVYRKLQTWFAKKAIKKCLSQLEKV